MSDTLIKLLAPTVIVEAGVAGIPPTPPSPPYCIDVTATVPGFKTIVVGPDADGKFTILTVSTGPVTTIAHDCFPGSLGSPGTAGRPVTFTTSHNVGWNASADSIGTLTGDGMYQFSVPQSAVGVVTGFNSQDLGSGYIQIANGIYCASGQFRIIENGLEQTPSLGFASADVFTIRRLGQQVAYYQGTTKLYTSTNPSSTTVFVDASLYFGGDSIVNAFLSTTVTSPYASIGNQGTYDPAAPGGNIAPPTTPGGIPEFDSVNANLQSVRGFSTDSTINAGGGVSTPPPPGPGDPGNGPGTNGGTDGNGDWIGRTGGDLRSLVGKAQAYDNGIVTTGSGGGSGSSDGTTDGDWNGRAGNQLRGLVGTSFGSAGSGIVYAICAGTLNDPNGTETGVTGTAEAGMIMPSFAVVDAALEPIAGFGIALAGMAGTTTGRLLGLRGFAANITDAEVISDPGTGPIGGGSSTTTTTLFDDTFTGSGDLSTHTPDVGGSYTGTTGVTADNVLNGTGGLPSQSATTADVTAALTTSPGDTFTYATVLTVTAAGAAHLEVDLSLATGINSFEVEALLEWNGTAWTLDATVGTGPAYDSGAVDVTALLTTGTPHTISEVVTPSGVSFEIDGTVVASTTHLPSAPITGVQFENHTAGGTSNVTFDQVSLVNIATTTAPGGIDPVTGDWSGRLGGQLRSLVGEAYEATAEVGGPVDTNVFLDNFTGTGTLATHSPDLSGGPYSTVGGGATSDYTLDGSGGLPSTTDAHEATATLTSPPGSSYTLQETFTVTTASSNTLSLDLSGIVSSTGVVPVESILVYNGSTYTIELIVRSSTGAVLYDSGALPVTIATGVPYTVAIQVTPAGTSVTINGVVEATTTAVPGAEPDAIGFTNTKTAGTSNATIDQIELFSIAPPTVGTFLGGTSIGSLIGFGHSDEITDGNGDVVGYGFVGVNSGNYPFSGFGGADLTDTLPRPSLSASGTVTTLGEFNGVGPSPSLTASGTVTLLGEFEGVHGGRYVIVAYGGGVCTGVLSDGTLLASGTVGRLAELNALLPHPQLTASGTTFSINGITGTLTPLQPTVSGRLSENLPRGTLYASGTVVVTLAYEGYSITLLQQGVATTHFTNYPFNQIIRLGTKYYGVATDGLFELTGDTFDTKPIVSVVQFAETDHGAPQIKRPRSLLIGGRLGADIALTVKSDEIQSNDYTYRLTPRPGARNHRFRLGRGIEGRYLSYTVTNVNGLDFQIDDVTPEFDVTRRDIWD